MKIYLANLCDSKSIVGIENISNVLESFFYFKDWQIPYLKAWKNFMLDSGAFTFMNSLKSAKIDWDAYVESYAAFINKHDIKLFFELDIDCLVGITEVERLRSKLENLTGKQSIPVWHVSRGVDYFLKMCSEYKYVAIGGIVTKEIKSKDYGKLQWFTNTAHKHDCKIHCLGFTSMKWLPELRFDSVDSTNWKNGRRFGQMHFFKNGIIESISYPNKRAKYHEVDAHNLLEWIMFQKYANVTY